MVWGQRCGIDDLVQRLTDNDVTLASLCLLRHRMFGEAEAVALSKALAANTTLKDLNLSSHAIAPGMASVLGTAVAANTTLRTLSIGDSTFDDAALESLCHGIAASRSLYTLDLEQKSISASGCAILAHALRTSAVQELLLAGNAIGSAGLVELARHLHRLRVLSLCSCRIADGSGVSQVLGSAKSLEKLLLDDNPIDAAAATAIAAALHEHSTPLTHLSLRSCADLGPHGVAVLTPSLPPSLQHLDLSGTRAGAVGLAALSQVLAEGALPSLTRLVLVSCDGEDESLATVVHGLNTHSDVLLDVSGNVVGAETIGALAASTAVIAACLHNCQLGGGTGEVALMELLAAPATFPSLQELDISGNHLCKDRLVEMLDTLAEKKGECCPSLTHLVIAANPGASADVVVDAAERAQQARPTPLMITRRSADSGENATR
jgi:hypothetical protein